MIRNVNVLENIRWVLSHVYNFMCGALVTCLGYFSPIKGVILVMVVTILLDLIIGVIAARRKGEGIRSKKLWRTIYKLFFAVMVVSMMYAIDKEMGMIQMHKLIAWLIAGFEMWSILENCASITHLRIFKLLKNLMHDKILDVTKIDIDEKQKKI